jgi:molybdenum cofactor cytidylyltransferase
LAAGSSSRLGQPKQLVRLNGETLVKRAARLLLSLETGEVVSLNTRVVCGYAERQVCEELEGLPLEIVINPNWQQGMAGSIACGASAIPDDADGILVMACDQWRVEKEDILRLISRWLSDISAIVASSWYAGKATVFGPPVIFPGTLKPELSFVSGDRGAKAVIERHSSIVEFVQMENAGFDLDVPEDLEEILSGSRQYPNN